MLWDCSLESILGWQHVIVKGVGRLNLWVVGRGSKWKKRILRQKSHIFIHWPFCALPTFILQDKNVIKKDSWNHIFPGLYCWRPSRLEQHCVPDTEPALISLFFTHFSRFVFLYFQHTQQNLTIIFLQMKTLKTREIKQLLQGCVVTESFLICCHPHSNALKEILSEE